MSKIYAQQKKPHETAGADSVQQAAPAFSNQAMLDILKAPENVRAKPLSQEMNEKMSQHFGVSLSGIKVFENENLNRIGETAFAHGNEIHVAKGQYAPGTAHGQEVLMHEATHVVQQGMGLAHSAGEESAALEAQAQAVQAGGSMGSISGFSMPAATAAAPVQGRGGRIRRKLKKLFSRNKQPQAAAPVPEMSNEQKIATHIMQGIVNQNTARHHAFHASVAEAYSEALERQADYRNSKPKRVESLYTQGKMISPKEFDQEVEQVKGSMQYAIDQLEKGPTPSKNVDLSRLDHTAVLNNVVQAQAVANDFHGLDVRKIFAEDSQSKMGDMDDGVVMDSSSYQKEIRFNRQLWENPSKNIPQDPNWATADNNFTLTHEFGHSVNYHLRDQLNNRAFPEEQENVPKGLSSDQVSQALLADALYDHSKTDENLKTILYRHTGTEQVNNENEQAFLRTLAGQLGIQADSRESSLLKTLQEAGYTSKYGSTDAGEMYAEAFAAHYDNENRRKNAKDKDNFVQNPYAPLSTQIVNRSKELFHSADARNKFFSKFWGK